MQLEIIESTYKKGRKFLHLKVRISDEQYGPVLCIFHVHRKKEETVKLNSAFVEGVVIPLQEHGRLLESLKSNQTLFDAVDKIANELMEGLPATAEEKLLEEAASLSKLTIDTVRVISATSVYTKKIKKYGKKLDTVFENDYEKHTLIIRINYQELESDYELKVEYNEWDGHKVTSTPANKQKTPIKDYLDEQAVKEIIEICKTKVDFLR